MPHSLFDMTGRVAVVSGTARGMGRAMALSFAEAGADTVLIDKNETDNLKTSEAVKQLGRQALTICCDVSLSLIHI